MNACERGALGDKLSLRRGWQFFFTVYYSTILIVSLSLTIRWTTGWISYDSQCIIYRSIAITLVGNSLYYLRKLYKNQINNHFALPSEEAFCSQRERGAILYYALRPFFACVLSIVLFYLISAELVFVTDSMPTHPDKFGIFVITLAFFVGFSTGKMLEKVLSIANNAIDRISDGK